MATAIITDSNSGISVEEGKQQGIYVIPMPVMIEDKTYFEGINLTQDEFFEALDKRKRVCTSQPSPQSMTSVWDTAFSHGYCDLVYIPMSSGLSNSYWTARAFAEDYDGRVQVADNHRISVIQRQSVLDAKKLAEMGWNARQIREKLEETAQQSLIYIGVETLAYLKAGGRITPAAAAMGTILNVKPLLVIRGEKLDAFAKIRGTKNCQKKEIEAMQREVEKYRDDGFSYRIGVANSYVRSEDSLMWKKMVEKAFPHDEIFYDPLSFSIGCHVGPDAFGMGISVAIE